MRRRKSATLKRDATIEEEWEATLEKLPTNFFTSREARLLDSETSGGYGYAAFPLTHHNNHDVNRFYQYKIDSSPLQEIVPTQYEAWLRTWGQFTRWCIAGGLISKTDGVREGALFECLTDRDFVEKFIEYYDTRGSRHTACRQAHKLKEICNIAHRYFLSKKKVEEAGLIQENSEVRKKQYPSNDYFLHCIFHFFIITNYLMTTVFNRHGTGLTIKKRKRRIGNRIEKIQNQEGG